MEISSEKIKSVFNYLCDELDRGNHFFQIFKVLEESYKNNRLSGAPYFFAGIYDACLREAILSLAKLLVPNKDSINIYYLLNLATQNTALFRFANSNKLINMVAKHQVLLEDLQPFIDELKEQRDQVIAHLDREHVNNPTKILSNRINLTMVDQSFDILLKYINTYMRYYDESEFSFGIIESNVKQEIEFILNLIEKEYK